GDKELDAGCLTFSVLCPFSAPKGSTLLRTLVSQTKPLTALERTRPWCTLRRFYSIARGTTCSTGGPWSGTKLRSTRGQSDLGCALDVAFALFIAEHHITENEVLAVARLFLGHDTATGQRRIVGYRSTELGGELFQGAGGEKFSEHAR